MPQTSSEENSFEFTFGPLSTERGREQRSLSLKVGLQHTAQLSPPDPKPGQEVVVSVTAGLGLSLKSAALLFSLDGSYPDPSKPVTFIKNMTRRSIKWDTLAWCFLETWSAAIPAQGDGIRVRYRVIGQSTSGEDIACPFVSVALAKTDFPLDAFDQRYLHRLQRNLEPQVYEYRVDSLEIPTWLQDAIILQIFVDRFAAGIGEALPEPADLSQPSGGTLRGVTSHLDYIADLGVNCLWLTPITPAASYHGYDPTAHTGVDPRLGSEEDFKDLVSEAHARGIRVLLDFVANHVSNQHPAFQKMEKSTSSPFRKWFFFRDGFPGYESFYDVPGQPILNTDNPDVRKYLISGAEHWLRLGCDGFRLDHAHGASHAFWSEFREATRAISPESVMIGEITDSPDSVLGFTGRMDGVLDFQLADLMRRYFGKCAIPSSWFIRELNDHYDYFSERLCLPSFLDNHDMNRFLWITGGNKTRLKLAALCLFTLPEPPILYYGTEVGLSQHRGVGALEESRLPMIWGEQQDGNLREFFTKLIHLRKNTPAVWKTPREVILIDDTSGILVYRNGDCISIINNSPKDTLLHLPIQDLLITNDPAVRMDSTGISLPAWGGAICRVSA